MNALAPILEPAAYTHVFARWRGARVREFWGPGNVGDLLIRRGAEQLYAAYGITVCDEHTRPDVVFYGGGGNMGPLYPGTRTVRHTARTFASEHGVPLIVLPQSWTGHEEILADQFFARENRSLEFCPSAILAPDLALAYSPQIEAIEPQHDCGWFFRGDVECAQPKLSANCGDPTLMATTGDDYLRLASLYRVIHTDRLHFAIAGMICQREVHLYGNSYFKNEAIYHLWLRGRGCHWASSVAEN